MLSYRHAFHAGNHADVLKHLIEVQLLHYLMQKDKSFWYIDTHAGAGCYALDRGFAAQNAEYEWHCPFVGSGRFSGCAGRLCVAGKGINPDKQMKLYPGSPPIRATLIT